MRLSQILKTRRQMLRNNKLNAFIKQFIMFGLVGVSNSMIFLLVYYSLLFIKVNYLLANTTGFLLSVINAYFWNSKYVFKKKDNYYSSSFTKSFLSYGSTFLLGTFFMFTMVNNLGISDRVAPILNLTLTIPLNYLLHRLWVFV